MNEYPDLAAKVEAGIGFTGNTDVEVLADLDALEASARWFDVEPLELALWGSDHSMVQRVERAIATDKRPLEDPANPPPGGPAAWAEDLNDGERNACYMLRNLFYSGEPLTASDGRVRTALNKLHNRVMSTAERTALLDVARPQVQRWRNASWTVQPGLGDVAVARAWFVAQP